MNLSETIFCDESGFTGPNLFSMEEPYFVFSSVCVDSKEVESYVNEILNNRKYNIQTNELKGAKLVKSRKGCEIAKNILEDFSRNTAIYIFEKKYALAAKFFEYIFEPVLASHNSFFYQLGFNRFISNQLYLSFLTQDEISEKMLEEFQKTMRNGDFSKLELILNTNQTLSKRNPILKGICEFAIHYKKEIENEIRSIRRYPATSTWVLELSTTALYRLLAQWGEKIERMQVYCDESKPISAQADFFDAMINRQDKHYLHIMNKRFPMTFNLSTPITSVKSIACPGVQIADIIASTINYSLKNQDNGFSQEFLHISEKFYFTEIMAPELEYADLKVESCFINTRLFQELIKRTQSNQDLFKGLCEFVTLSKLDYQDFKKRGTL